MDIHLHVVLYKCICTVVKTDAKAQKCNLASVMVHFHIKNPSFKVNVSVALHAKRAGDLSPQLYTF